MGFFFYFAQCSALMVCFVFLFRWMSPFYSRQSKKKQQAIFGILFGLMGIASMLFPYHTGLRLDARLETIFFSGVFGGPLSVLLTTLLISVYRLSLEGYLMSALGSIFSGALIGLAAYRIRSKCPRVMEKYAVLFGLALGLQSLIWAYFRPIQVNEYLGRYFVPFALFHAFAVPFFYALIAYAMKRGETEKQLRNSESSLLHYKDRLEELVAARTAELATKNVQLEEAKEAAEAANRTKGEFLANMSHEIRTPLNAVIGLSYLMQRTTLSEQQKGYVDKTILSAKNLLSLINDILDISKIEAGKVTLEQIEFNLYEVLNQISNLVGIKAYDKGLKLSFSIHHEVPQMLVGDPLRLNQVLLNLSNNAVKFTDQGEIVFDVAVLSRDEEGILLEFSVTDTGIGIPKEQHDKLFQVFTQADMSTTRVYGGTGLGLVISKNIVNLMGGTIHSVSVPGQGSRFYFTARFGHFDGSAIENKQEETPPQPLHALLICDNPEMKLVLKGQLLPLEFDIALVNTGAEAFAHLNRQERYDLVMIDWMLGSENAVRLAEKLRLDAPAAIGSIVLISAYHEPEWESLVQSSAIEKVLHYPISQSQLYNEMVNLFQTHFTRKQELQDPDQAERFTALYNSSLLLAEDNEINQQVAVELLKEMGARIDVAGNGLQAMELAAKKRYDAILMDLQMPFMSGYEAARQIRRAGLSKEAPIIAMTADAMKGVENEVLRAGMNAHVTKPFDPIQLFGVLQRLMQSTRIRVRTGDIPASPSALGVPEALPDGRLNEPPGELLNGRPDAPGALLDVPLDGLPDGRLDGQLDGLPDGRLDGWPDALPGLAVNATLERLNQNRLLYLEIVRAFAQKHSAAVRDIREAAWSSNWEEALELTHSLIGVAANIGAPDLAETVRRLEDDLRGTDKGRLEGTLESAEEQLSVVLRSISNLANL